MMKALTSLISELTKTKRSNEGFDKEILRLNKIKSIVKAVMSSLPNNTVSIENVFKTVRTRKAVDWNKESLSKFGLYLMQLTRKKQLTGLQAYSLMVSLASKVTSNELCVHTAELLDAPSEENKENIDLSELEALGDALIVACDKLAIRSKSVLALPLLGDAESAVIVEIEIALPSVLENLVVYFLTTSYKIQRHQQQVISNAAAWLAEVLQLSSSSVMLNPRCLLAALQLFDNSTAIMMLTWSIFNDTIAALCKSSVLHMSVQSMDVEEILSLSVVENAFKELARVMSLPGVVSQPAIADFVTQSLTAVIEGLLKHSFDLDRLGVDSMMQYGIEEVLTSAQCKVLELCYLILEIVLEAIFKCRECSKLTWRQMSVICFDLKSLAMVLAAVKRSRHENGQTLVALSAVISNHQQAVRMDDGSENIGTRFWQDTIMKVSLLLILFFSLCELIYFLPCLGLERI